MEVSIVTPVYNDPRVAGALDSLFAQTGVDVESIVVDGGSTDETVAVLDRYADDVDTLVREPDDGIYDAMNTGIERATGDVVGILNADDRYQDDRVLADVADRLADTGADCCYGDLVYVDADDAVVRYWHAGQPDPRRFYAGWMPPHPTLFVRRSVYDEFGDFDLSYDIAADYELMLRYLVIESLDVAYCERVLVRMALGGASNASVGNILAANREVLRAWREHGRLGGPVAVLGKLARKPAQYVRGWWYERRAREPYTNRRT